MMFSSTSLGSGSLMQMCLWTDRDLGGRILFVSCNKARHRGHLAALYELYMCEVSH